MGENRQTLERIVTLLLSLADLAERASARPRPVLWLVLCILRPAEAIAHRFVTDVARSSPMLALVFALPPAGAAEEPAEALRLALVFRLLAAVLGGIAAADVPPSGMRPSSPRQAHGRLGSPAAAPPTAFDTS